MPRVKFNPEAARQALQNGVAEIYGMPHGANLDDRQLFYLRLVSETGCLISGKHLVDLGPGLSAFGPVARQMGLQVTLVDDFGGGGGVDQAGHEATVRIIGNLRSKLGIRVEELDFVSHPLPLETASVDVVTCFHSLEHWHNSPKRLFREIARILRPRGFLILATPNAANLRKRIQALLGGNIYVRLENWYHDGDPVYRGHVREPIIKDLHRMLAWNDMEVVVTYGRNFIGRQSRLLTSFLPAGMVEGLGITADYLLSCVPSLCSDIHVIGQKRQ